jgi:hypothetical protein
MPSVLENFPISGPSSFGFLPKIPSPKANITPAGQKVVAVVIVVILVVVVTVVVDSTGHGWRKE